ncbi:MAG TPA: hypothetical protein VFG94_02325 [Acidimicrobiales bacterium]|nr:hypothetical protein [Acidimicrobiales bacterium]
MSAAPADSDTVPRSARWLVGALFVLLLVPGLVGFDAWPLTGWRLFSLARGETQTLWVLEAVDSDGSSRLVDVEELPLRYRHAEWPMADLPGASSARRQAVCEALLGAVVDVEPGTAQLRIARDRARLEERDGDWTVIDDLEVIHTCAPTDLEDASP